MSIRVLMTSGLCAALALMFPPQGESYPGSRVESQGVRLDELAELLGSDDPEQQRAAVVELVRLGAPGYPARAKALNRPSGAKQARIVEVFLGLGTEGVPALLAAIRLEKSGDLRHNGGVNTLVRMGKVALPVLRTATKDVNQEVRLSAAAALRIMAMGPGAKDVLGVLGEVVRTHDDADMRWSAAESIGTAGWLGGQRGAALKLLPEALADSEPDVRGAAAMGLVRLQAWREHDVVGALVGVLESKNRDLAYMATSALAQLGPSAKEAIPALLKLVESGSSPQASAAAEALGKIGPAAVPELLQAVNSTNREVRERALLALSESEAAGRIPTSVLLPMLKDPDASVRGAAAKALGEVAPSTAIVGALKRLLSGEQLDVQRAAVGALGRIGSAADTAVPSLVSLLEDDPKDHEFEICRALGAIGPGAEAAIPALEAVLVESYPGEAAAALGRIGTAAVPVLTRALSHEKSDVRTSAAMALGYIGPDGANAVPALTRSLSDPEVRVYAIQALGFVGPAASTAVPALTAQLEVTEGNVCYFAVRSLRQIGSATQAALDLLGSLLGAPNPELRLEVAHTLLALEGEGKAVAVLVSFLKARQPFFRGQALTAIEGAGQHASAAVTALAELVVDEGATDRQWRLACAQLLVRIEKEPAAGQAFFKSRLTNSSDRASFEAALVLASVGVRGQDVKAVLQRGKEYSDRSVAVACAGALLAFPTERSMALSLLSTALDSDDMQLRRGAAFALTRAGVADAKAIALLRRDLRAKDGSGFPLQAVEALSEVAAASAEARATLTEALHHEQDRVRRAALVWRDGTSSGRR